MRAATFKASVANATQVRSRNGRFVERLLWRPIRRHTIGTLARCITALKVTFNRNALRSSLAPVAPIAMATAMAMDPIPRDPISNKQSTSASSVLSNGPLPKSLILGELLGSGTFGEVYRGFDEEAGKEVAVKIVLKTRQGDDPASMALVKQRIEHEVSMWCELQSFPSAARLEKFYEDEERVYFVQELLNGGSVEDLMKIRGFLSEIEAAHVMQTVLSLAAFCHERDICYCDIKPANFILPSSIPSLSCLKGSSFVKVVDFGSCEHVPKKGLRGAKGTPLYMAPEVQNSRYGVESDMWSAGVMLFYLLSGEIPFIGKPDQETSPSALNFYLEFGELTFDAPVWKNVSEDVKDLISKMLERNIEKRMTAKDALEHRWMRQLVTTDWPLPIQGAVSDICPMDTSRVFEQTP